MVRPVGNPIADDAARFMAIVADAEHAGGDESNSTVLATRLADALADSLARPIKNAQIEARSEYHAIRAAASKPQTFGSFCGNVNRHWMEIEGNPNFTLGKRYRLSLNQIANHFDAGLEFIKRRCLPSLRVYRSISRAQSQYGPPFRDFIERGRCAREDRRVTEYHVGDGDAQKHPFLSASHRWRGPGRNRWN